MGWALFSQPAIIESSQRKKYRKKEREKNQEIERTNESESKKVKDKPKIKEREKTEKERKADKESERTDFFFIYGELSVMHFRVSRVDRPTDRLTDGQTDRPTYERTNTLRRMEAIRTAAT